MAKQELAELPLSGGKLNIMTIGQLSSTPLSSRLLTEISASGNRNDEIAKEIAGSHELRACAEGVNEDLQKIARPVGTTKDAAALIYKAMEPLIIQYGRPRLTDDELVKWWRTYYMVLGEYPLQAIEHAISEWIRWNAADEVHMIPIAAKLAKLAAPKARELFVAALRVRKALEMPAPAPVITDEDRAKGAEMFQKTLNELAARKAARMADRRPPMTKTQMAAQMRASADDDREGASA